MKKILISDVSLKYPQSGTQPATLCEKKNFVKKLVSLGVDAIELPAPGNGKEDVIVNRTITAECGACRVKIPVGTSEESCGIAWSCVEKCADPCLQVILPVSTVGMEYQYHMKSAKMLERIASLCKMAAEKNCVVEFVAQDATRAELSFLTDACRTAAENGAAEITLCDDAGTAMPEEIAAMTLAVRDAVPEVCLYAQVSDAVSMAAASAVRAIAAGADGVKTSVTDSAALSLDRFADLLRAKGEALGFMASLDVTAVHQKITALKETSRGPGKAAPTSDGSEAFVDPESSMQDICEKIASLGYELPDTDNGKVYEEFRRVSARKGKIDVRELEAVIASTAMQVPSTYHLVSYVINSGNIITATAHITLKRGEEEISGVSLGDGPIDASFHAIEQIIGHHYELEDFQIQAVTEGREALGSALVKLTSGGVLYSGNGISTDIVGASIRAYLNALNKIVYEEG